MAKLKQCITLFNTWLTVGSQQAVAPINVMASTNAIISDNLTQFGCLNFSSLSNSAILGFCTKYMREGEPFLFQIINVAQYSECCDNTFLFTLK